MHWGRRPLRVWLPVEHVELKVALAAAEGDGGVVAHHLRADHRERLALRRVDLARHDRRAWLILRQAQLAEATARAGAEEAQVVGDLVERAREHVERARGCAPRDAHRAREGGARAGGARAGGAREARGAARAPSTMASCAASASNLFGADVSGSPVSCRSISAISSA